MEVRSDPLTLTLTLTLIAVHGSALRSGKVKSDQVRLWLAWIRSS